MIDKIAANNQPLIESGSSAGQPSRSRGPGGNDVDVSVQVNYASLVDKAIQPLKTDDQAVREARQLLSSGKLDNMDIIRQAADNILKYGI
jgi:hypothetical protein